ncbi:MAG: abequosyltransferase [Bacillota bacterium]|nr:MAG: abequosyltransferase [Bacillota bacterium]
MSIKLSICIPTYNRSSFLTFAVNTIGPQLTDGVEIVISDNASSDDTQAVVGELMQRWPAIRYVRQDQNVGLDRNLLYLVEQARGEYCWFVSDDDGFCEGAISTMLGALGDGCDVYICGTKGHSREMAYIEDDFPLNGDGKTFDLSDRRQMLDFLKSARRPPFSFISVLCFKREKWLSVLDKNAMVGTVFNHVYCVFAMVQSGLLLRYVNKPLVIFRAGNCGFGKTGMVERFLADIGAYIQVAERCFAQKKDVQELLVSLVARQHPIYKLAFMFYLANSKQKARLKQVVKRVYGKRVYYSSRFMSQLGSFWVIMYFIRQCVVLKNDVEFVELWRSVRGTANNQGWH